MGWIQNSLGEFTSFGILLYARLRLTLRNSGF